jgi:solute carrier family 25 protein 38
MTDVSLLEGNKKTTTLEIKESNLAKNIINHNQSNTNRNDIAKSIIFGSTSGFITSVLLQPLDRLKTLSQQNIIKDKKCVKKYSLFQFCQKIYYDNGITGFWRGLTPTLLRVVPGVSIHFGLYQTTKLYIYNPQRGYEHFAIGFFCRSFAAIILHPTTVIKTQLESSVYGNQSTVNVGKAIIREYGIRGLWFGLIPTLLRDAPFSGLYLMFYRQQLTFVEYNDYDITPIIRLSCGMSAGVLACFITQPFDVLKTTAQLYPKDYSSVVKTVQKLYKNLGTGVFFKGFILRASRRTLTAALNWTFFDELIKRTSSS